MVNKSIVDLIPDSFFGFDELMLKALKNSKRINIKEFKGYWLDIGRPDDYVKAIEDFDSMKEKFI